MAGLRQNLIFLYDAVNESAKSARAPDSNHDGYKALNNIAAGAKPPAQGNAKFIISCAIFHPRTCRRERKLGDVKIHLMYRRCGSALYLFNPYHARVLPDRGGLSTVGTTRLLQSAWPSYCIFMLMIVTRTFEDMRTILSA